MRGTGKVMVNTLLGNALGLVKMRKIQVCHERSHSIYSRDRRPRKVQLDKAKSCKFNPMTDRNVAVTLSIRHLPHGRINQKRSPANLLSVQRQLSPDKANMFRLVCDVANLGAKFLSPG